MRAYTHFMYVLLIIAAQCNKENGMFAMGRTWLEATSDNNVSVNPETVSYFLAKLAPEYRANNNDWKNIHLAQQQRMLDEMENNDINYQNMKENISNIRTKKHPSRIGESGSSLSIVNSLDVLRKRLLLEIARKKAKEEANRNRQILISFGKRGGYNLMANYPGVLAPY